MNAWIFPEGIDYRQFTETNIKQYCYDEPLKDKGDILFFLKHFSDQAIISGKKLIDPRNGKVFSTHSEYYQLKGLEWSNAATYFFEKYDVILNDDFLKKIRKILKNRSFQLYD